MRVGDVVLIGPWNGVGVVVEIARVTSEYTVCKVAREDGGVYAYSEKWLDGYNERDGRRARRTALGAAAIAAEAVRRIG